MKITRIETLRLDEFPHLCWVELHTDAGLTGVGETCLGARAVEAVLHETVAPWMLGLDPLAIERHSRRLLQNSPGRNTSGAEIRAASAVDIALWDLLGKVTGQPAYQLLGGRVRDEVRTYNTCAGYHHHHYEDLDGFLDHADDLAESLIAEGYGGMSFWPFDFAADNMAGADISVADIKRGLLPLEKVRQRVGDGIDLHVDMHALWQLPAAMKIARALEPLEPYWFEDPVKPSNLDAMRQFKDATRIWTTAGDAIGTRWDFHNLFERQATSACLVDVGRCGGLSEAKKIATMAEGYELPLATQDGGGPVQLTAAVHLAVASPNCLVQEVVRAFYFGWYQDLVEDLPPLDRGHIAPMDLPGLGVRMRESTWRRQDAHRVASEA